jgi:hypothetical protein
MGESPVKGMLNPILMTFSFAPPAVAIARTKRNNIPPIALLFMYFIPPFLQ